MLPAVPSLQNPRFCDHGDLLLGGDFWEMPILHTPAAGLVLRNFYEFKQAVSYVAENRAMQVVLPTGMSSSVDLCLEQ